MALRHGPSVPGALCRLSACLLAIALGAAPGARPALAQSASIDDVKAAFLFNFTKFVQWPAGAFPNDTSTFEIGILGDDTVGDSLRETIRGKTVDGRELRLKRVSAADNLEQLQVLFISKSDTSRVLDLVTRMTGKAVLTVADSPGFCQSGGVIQFDIDNDQVRFEINLEAAQRSRLNVSSKLLALAKAVYSKRK
jgi:hypothetical protein